MASPHQQSNQHGRLNSNSNIHNGHLQQPHQQWSISQQQQQQLQYHSQQANQQQYQQANRQIVKEHFRVMLSSIRFLDQEEANKISMFASHHHNLAAEDITNVICEFIRDNQERQFLYLYAMDKIMKNVQGAYIKHFSEKLRYVIGLVLQRAAQNRDDQKNLVKMFKTWEVLGLFDQQLLNDIAQQGNLRYLEAQLLTQPEELEKIQLLKEKLEPSNLPSELVNSGDYICGTQIDRQQIWAKHRALLSRQFGASGQMPPQPQNNWAGPTAGYTAPPSTVQAQLPSSSTTGAPLNNSKTQLQPIKVAAVPLINGQTAAPVLGVAAASSANANGAASVASGGREQSTIQHLLATLGQYATTGSGNGFNPNASNGNNTIINSAANNGTKLVGNGSGGVNDVSNITGSSAQAQGGQNAQLGQVAPRDSISTNAVSEIRSEQQQATKQQQPPQATFVSGGAGEVASRRHQQQQQLQQPVVQQVMAAAALQQNAASTLQTKVAGAPVAATAASRSSNQASSVTATGGPGGELTAPVGQQAMMNHHHLGGASDVSGNNSDWRSGSGQPQQQFASPINNGGADHHTQSVAQQQQQQLVQHRAQGGHHHGSYGRHHQMHQPPNAQQQRNAMGSMIHSVPPQISGSATSVRSTIVQSNQKSVGFRQFGFLPSLLKSFTSYNKNQQLSLGNFIFHQASSTSQGTTADHGNNQHSSNQALCPTFSNLETLKTPSLAAQIEVFQGIKFQCSICGMRFVRNLTLKEHLNAHFEQNLALKRRGDRTMARDQYQGFADFVAARKHIIKQDGEAAGGSGGLQRQQQYQDLVPYDGSKSHIATYNICYICKERLDTYHDDQDEGWYFVETRQVRFSTNSAKSAHKQLMIKGATTSDGTVITASAPTTSSMVVNVHTNCLKEIEELNFSGSTTSIEKLTSSQSAAQEKEQVAKKSAIENPTVTTAGQKRTYVDAQQEGGIEETKNGGDINQQQDDVQLRGLQDIIKGLESQKRRRITIATDQQ